MIGSSILRLAAGVFALACVAVPAADHAQADEITIPGDQVAAALRRLFGNAQMRLHSARDSQATMDSSNRTPTYYDPKGSYVRFGGALGNFQYPLFTAEMRQQVRLSSSDSGGGENYLVANFANADSSRVGFGAVDDGFQMTFIFDGENPEVAVNCVHRRGGVNRTCPASASPGQGPKINWNTPVDWENARLRIKLKPVVHSGGLALRVVEAELEGDVDPPDGMGCASGNMVPGDFCFALDNFIEGIQTAKLRNPRFPHDLAAMTFVKTVKSAFDDERVKNQTALQMVGELARYNVVGRICGARMEGGNLVLDGERRHLAPGEQVPVPQDLNPDNQPRDFNPAPPIPEGPGP